MRSWIPWVAVAAGGGCTTTAAPPPASVAASPARAEPAPPRQCSRSTFARAADGFSWSVGDAVLRFRTSERADDEPSYNYRNRTARIEWADDPNVYIESSAYAETDCSAPPDPDGNALWCLVSHGLDGQTTLFGLIQAHRPCETGLALLEAFAKHSTAPTAFRVALTTYPGAIGDDSSPYDEIAEAGVPAEVRTRAEALAKAAEDADTGYGKPDGNAAAARALRDFRRVLAPYLDVEPAWQLDLTAERALARLDDRYPYTFVGPNETFYDAVGTDTEPSIAPVSPDWASPGR